MDGLLGAVILMDSNALNERVDGSVVMDSNVLDERVNGYRDPRDGPQYPGWADCRVPGGRVWRSSRTPVYWINGGSAVVLS